MTAATASTQEIKMKPNPNTNASNRPVAGSKSPESVMIRRARSEDAEALRAMHRVSLLALGPPCYTPRQIEGLLRDVDTVDDAILADGTCLLAEVGGAVVASGAWTLRPPAYTSRLPATLPELAARHRATVRSVFTHPGFVRRGLASAIMRVCEEEAVIHGLATHIELHATLPAALLYQRLGYEPQRAMSIALSNGERFAAIFMIRSLTLTAQAAA
jgi:GNAT superfamily N-acetyltransferase